MKLPIISYDFLNNEKRKIKEEISKAEGVLKILENSSKFPHLMPGDMCLPCPFVPYVRWNSKALTNS